jgi:hypothetical protein
MKSRIKRVIGVMLPVALSLLVSYATVPKIKTPPEEFKANLGTIGIVSASFQPEVRLGKPMGKGSAALHFAGKGAGVGLWVAAQGSNAGPAALVALGFVPIGAAIGSIVGLAKGVPCTEIKEPEKALRSYLATENFQETMRERSLSVAGEQARYPFVPVEAQGPKTPDEEVTYAFLSDSSIDTVLEISVHKCELLNRDKNPGVNPHLYLGLVAGIKLIRVADGKVTYSEKFVDQWSNSLKFSDWGANDAEPFREGLGHAFRYLAGRMMDRLTGIQAPVDSPPAEEL